MKSLITLVLLIMSTCLFADTGRLNQLLHQFTSLQANFTEVIVDSQGNKINSSGVLYIKKPKQFRWQANQPNQELFISDGKKVWNVEPDLEQVTVGKLSNNLSTTPLMLLSGNAQDISQVFSVFQKDKTHYLLIPKNQDAMIKQVVLGFDDAGSINSLTVTNTLGAESTLHLTDVKMNEALPQNLFTYTPAPNMDVLQQ